MQTDIIPLHEISENIIVRRIEKSSPLNFKGTHRHNFYEMLYFTEVAEGQAHSIDFRKSRIETGCIYVLKPRQVYDMELTTQKGYLIAIKPEYLSSFYAGFDSYLYITLPDKILMDGYDLNTMKQTVLLIGNELSHKRRTDLIASLVNTLVTQCILSFNDNIRKSGIDKRVLKLIALIDEHYLTEREVTFYASQMSLSEKRIGTLTKQALGHTVKGLILQRLMLEAKRLINQGNLSFKSIAFRLGFADASYFSRFFKKYAGSTPEQFKAMEVGEDNPDFVWH